MPINMSSSLSRLLISSLANVLSEVICFCKRSKVYYLESRGYSLLAIYEPFILVLGVSVPPLYKSTIICEN